MKNTVALNLHIAVISCHPLKTDFQISDRHGVLCSLNVHVMSASAVGHRYCGGLLSLLLSFFPHSLLHVIPVTLLLPHTLLLSHGTHHASATSTLDCNLEEIGKTENRNTNKKYTHGNRILLKIKLGHNNTL